VDCLRRAMPGKLRCVIHQPRQLIRARAYLRRRRRQRIQNGLCAECAVPSNSGRCDKCLAMARLWCAKSRRKRVLWWAKNGRCVRCGYRMHSIIDEGHRVCINCRLRIRVPIVSRTTTSIRARFGGERAPWGFTTGRTIPKRHETLVIQAA